MISLTPSAARKIKTMAAKLGRPQGFLRVKVVPGGCSGLSYKFEIETEPQAGDLVVELDGAKAAVDPKSDLFLKGSTVDYVDTLMKSGFEVMNPLATQSCSCGTSFTTADTAPTEETFSV
jgi:iron-sulfur cluster assembly accessory protein